MEIHLRETDVRRRVLVLLPGCLAVLGAVLPTAAEAQRETGFDNPYYTTGTEVAPSTLVPSVRKWYLPQRLYSIYDWRQDHYSNYAREPYERYTSVFLEGSPFYDVYGNYITQGWMVYDWTEDYPSDSGSSISKDRRFNQWFNNILISQSHQGQFHSSLMVGDGIRTTLTPLTFSKPRFDGIQWDLRTDKYGLTMLSSRVSHTGDLSGTEDPPSRCATPCSPISGRPRARPRSATSPAPAVTFVNAAHRNSNVSFGDNSLSGLLSGPLNADFVRSIIVRITDDSPEDGEGGALLSRWRIFVDGVDHTDDIIPTIEGGVRRRGRHRGQRHRRRHPDLQHRGLLAQRGGRDRRLPRDRTHRDRPGAGQRLRVEITSNKQTNSLGAPVFLPVLRAPGNVKDGSNQAFHRFRYGLPTGNRLVGFDLAIIRRGRLELKGEMVRNYQYRRFPNENITRHQELATKEADAFYVTAQQRTYPWTLFAEAFSLDAEYSTRAFIPNAEGEVNYDNEQRHIFEFVDDNDDQDELADWTRRYFGPRVNTRQGLDLLTDNAVFPGIDEDNDDISDFNRNFNTRPDYEEPFLRFDVEPPEFLFGMDMNSNGVIDRFEDDSQADYPYKLGNRGYNAYVGLEIAPRHHPHGGTARPAAAEDQPRQPDDLPAAHRRQGPAETGPEPLLRRPSPPGAGRHPRRRAAVAGPARHEGAVGLHPRPPGRPGRLHQHHYLEAQYDRYLPFTAKVKHEYHDQRGEEDEGLREPRFLGVMTKGEYAFDIRRWRLMPRWKQLYSSRTPSSQRPSRRRS